MAIKRTIDLELFMLVCVNACTICCRDKCKQSQKKKKSYCWRVPTIYNKKWTTIYSEKSRTPENAHYQDAIDAPNQSKASETKEANKVGKFSIPLIFQATPLMSSTIRTHTFCSLPVENARVCAQRANSA